MKPPMIAAFASGVLVSFALGLSGMTHPSKVIGFLDIFGNWDPSLMFVMGGAVMTNFVLFRLIYKRKAPVLESAFTLPKSKIIDAPLIAGSVLFGLGWGLSGYCPGPALASSVSASKELLVFIGAMLAGMFLYGQVTKKSLTEDG